MNPPAQGRHPCRSISNGVTRLPRKIGLKARLGLVALMATVAFSASGSSLPEVGSAAPPLDLKASDGTSHSLAAIDGPRVLVFFRGLW